MAGALGLVAGPLVGLLAAVGVIGYFAGAVAAHLRVRDHDVAPSGTLPLCSGVAALVLTVLARHR